MKKLIIVIIMMGMFISLRGQAVYYNDSNYVYCRSDPYPPYANERPITPFSVGAGYSIPCHNGHIYPADSVEHIYGIAFTADTAISERIGRVRDSSMSVFLYLYKVPAGTSDFTLLDSLAMDCTMPYKMFVYESYDTFCTPHRYREDTVPVFERLFSREYEFGPGDSVLVTWGQMPKASPGHGLWRGYLSQSCGNQIYHGRLVIDYETYRCLPSTAWGPEYAIRHRACSKMEGVRVDTVDGTMVCISWPPVDTTAGEAILYRVEYGPEGFWYGGGVYSEGVVADSIVDTTFCIGGLAENTLYTFYVSAYCPAMRQYGMPDSVRVLTNDKATCAAPSRLRCVGTTATSVKLAWDTVGEQRVFEMRVKPSDGTAVMLITPDSNPYELTGLARDVEYFVWMRAQCHHQCAVHDTLVWGPWIGPSHYHVNREGVGLVMEDVGFRLVPNPASGVVRCETEDEDFRGGVLTVADAAGREVLRKELAQGTRRYSFSVADLPAGTYFVTLVTKDGTGTKRLVVEGN